MSSDAGCLPSWVFRLAVLQQEAERLARPRAAQLGMEPVSACMGQGSVPLPAQLMGTWVSS